MKVTIENEQIAEAFKAVWDALPEEDRATLEKRIAEVVFHAEWKVKRSFTYMCNSGVVIYDATADKANQPPYIVLIPSIIGNRDVDLIMNDITHLLAHVCREHVEEMYRSNGFLSLCDDLEESKEEAEMEADELVRIWADGESANE